MARNEHDQLRSGGQAASWIVQPSADSADEALKKARAMLQMLVSYHRSPDVDQCPINEDQMVCYLIAIDDQLERAESSVEQLATIASSIGRPRLPPGDVG